MSLNSFSELISVSYWVVSFTAVREAGAVWLIAAETRRSGSQASSARSVPSARVWSLPLESEI